MYTAFICIFMCYIFFVLCNLCRGTMEHSGETQGTSCGGRPPKRKGSPNFRWSAEQIRALILFLSEQVDQGMKCHKTFKTHAFIAAARHINSMFNQSISEKQVRNHYRGLKKRLSDINAAMRLTGSGWDDDTKMITFEAEIAANYYKVFLDILNMSLIEWFNI
jgi:hypothetical protein